MKAVMLMCVSLLMANAAFADENQGCYAGEISEQDNGTFYLKGKKDIEGIVIVPLNASVGQVLRSSKAVNGVCLWGSSVPVLVGKDSSYDQYMIYRAAVKK